MSNLTTSEWFEIIFIILIVSIQIAVAIRVGCKLRGIRNFIPDGASLKLKSYYVDGNMLKSASVEAVIANANKVDEQKDNSNVEDVVYSRGTNTQSAGRVFFSNTPVPKADALYEIRPEKTNGTYSDIKKATFVPCLSTDKKIEMFAKHPEYFEPACTINVLPSDSNSFTVLSKGQAVKENESDKWRITYKCIINIHYKGGEKDNDE